MAAAGPRQAAPIGRDILLAALNDGRPPLAAYPTSQRNRISAEQDPTWRNGCATLGHSGSAAHELPGIQHPRMPKGLAKVLHLNWALVVLLIAVACYGFVMLYSVAGGNARPWMEPQCSASASGWR